MDAAAKLLARRQGLAAPPPKAPTVPAAVPVAPVPVSVAGVMAGLPSIPAMPTVNFQGLSGTIITYLFYLSAAAFILFLLLTFVHFTITPIFSISPYDNGIIRVSTTQDKETAWTSAPPDNTGVTTLVNPKSCDYTISLDVFVQAAYQPITAPHVILYRSDSEVIMLNSVKASDLQSTFPTTNILAYIDSAKNDLNIYVVTTNAASNVYNKESVPPITNIPQGVPFRLSIAFMPNYIEVYINGKLNATTILQGTPLRTSSQFWSPPKLVADTVKVGNLYYWPRALMASELQSLVSTSADFFTKKT